MSNENPSAANQIAAQQARILLEFFGPNGERWCQGSFARNGRGQGVNVKDPEAISFCLRGAARLLIPSDLDRDAFYCAIEPDGLAATFNDSNHWEVVKARLEEIAAS